MKTKAGTELPIILLKGKEYLEVKWRLVWFREERPDWSIETGFADLQETHALAKATIKDQSGRVIATGHKREDRGHFPDFAEKAETGAIGRALALCGYGTQFSPEIEEGERIVDSPVEKPKNTLRAVDDFGTYVIPFGKHKGKRLDTFGAHDLNNWCEWMRAQGELSGKAKEAVDAAEAYLKTREFERAK